MSISAVVLNHMSWFPMPNYDFSFTYLENEIYGVQFPGDS